MSRLPASTDFPVTVDGVGNFIFAQRKMRDHMDINVEYARITQGVSPTPWLDQVAQWLATLKVLAVTVPEGFNPDDMDPLDDETYAKLLKVHAALRAKEDSFRRRPQEAGKGDGAAA